MEAESCVPKAITVLKGVGTEHGRSAPSSARPDKLSPPTNLRCLVHQMGNMYRDCEGQFRAQWDAAVLLFATSELEFKFFEKWNQSKSP